MIRYELSRADLEALIEAEAPGWLDRAQEKTRDCVAKGRVDEKDGVWSEIKAVYARIQHYKCVYCEKPLPNESSSGGDASLGRGAVEYDVEHYRPKNGVTPWPDTKTLSGRPIPYKDSLRSGEPEGYVRLAFDPENYGLACKTCNSGHKGNGFPIAGSTRKTLRRRSALDAREKPLLMLPLGEGVEDPEAVLGWLGPVPVPRKTSGHEGLKAQVCIDFFALDARGDLLFGRAQVVALLWPALEALADAQDPAARATLAERVRGLCGDRIPFVASARAFAALHAADRALAKKLYERSTEYLVSRDRAVFG